MFFAGCFPKFPVAAKEEKKLLKVGNRCPLRPRVARFFLGITYQNGEKYTK
jgi:hypothetical protein